ncbi:hypothetical protein TrVE_jg7357 [Triparma verrucosa]|uniref:Hexosyltransferase n=1 Tax=Triparma verrucosa TaxID=1606542 RepID=A0A9W7BLF5_9STRA|nr:hypothetical protein TrVE_jg7357 [Triparma verrucosa]
MQPPRNARALRCVTLIIALALIFVPTSINASLPSSISTTVEGNELSSLHTQAFLSRYVCDHPPPILLDSWNDDVSQPGITPYSPFRLDKYLVIQPECFSVPPPSPSFINDESLDHYTSLEIPPVLSIGIISAEKNTAHRLSIRSTWLNSAHSPENHKYFTHKFFLALPASERLSDLPLQVLLEAIYFRDIMIQPFPDSYLKTPIKSISLFDHGVRAVGAYYILRVNDDVYVDLDKVFEGLKSIVPSRVYGFLNVEGDEMRIPRPRYFGVEDGREGQERLLKENRAWTFLEEDYFSDAVPNFCQGNAIILSQDLAIKIATLKDMPWVRKERVADDILIAVTLGGGEFRRPDVGKIGYEHEGKFVRCNSGDGIWYNIHPEYFYALHENKISGQDWCHGLDEVLCCGIQ